MDRRRYSGPGITNEIKFTGGSSQVPINPQTGQGKMGSKPLLR